MARVYLKDHKRVPVAKNMLFAIKLGWEADKRLLIGYLINMIANVFVKHIDDYVRDSCLF